MVRDAVEQQEVAISMSTDPDGLIPVSALDEDIRDEATRRAYHTALDGEPMIEMNKAEMIWYECWLAPR